ncbi:hypothetical protein GBA52_005682 [Prunus armeniaca]|nr:hypothetical protein GBA52_005682 [Prunus armeniaca]
MNHDYILIRVNAIVTFQIDELPPGSFRKTECKCLKDIKTTLLKKVDSTLQTADKAKPMSVNGNVCRRVKNSFL